MRRFSIELPNPHDIPREAYENMGSMEETKSRDPAELKDIDNLIEINNIKVSDLQPDKNLNTGEQSFI
jgi:hypothetical protein